MRNRYNEMKFQNKGRRRNEKRIVPQNKTNARLWINRQLRPLGGCRTER
jgi:hypothetical protein